MTYSAHEAWRQTLQAIMVHGEPIVVRGWRTMELMPHTISFPMDKPIVQSWIRKLGYRFLCAEAWWILSGDDRVSTIQPYAKMINDFSDDGERFQGAYGPRFRYQYSYVLHMLKKDPSTRQAVMTIWRANPGESKDIPCTVSLHWMTRKNKIHCFAHMRSSDAWLGAPYDWFNFTMMTLALIADLRMSTGKHYELGHLHFTADSCHLYERNWTGAMDCIQESFKEEQLIQVTSDNIVHSNHLIEILGGLKDGKISNTNQHIPFARKLAERTSQRQTEVFDGSSDSC